MRTPAQATALREKEAAERANMPGDWARLTEFRQLLIIRALRPDRITNALQNFCEHMMGSAYVNQVRHQWGPGRGHLRAKGCTYYLMGTVRKAG